MKTASNVIHPKVQELIIPIVEAAKAEFRGMLEEVAKDGGLTQERYARYLSMQYHLTKGVQRPFLTIAAHEDLGTRRELRKFLVGFANEEEFHFEIARRDLEAMGLEPHPISFDVELWWAYFNSIVQTRPFVRLGATCILENIADGSRDLIQKLFGEAKYLTQKNTVFFRIHQHDESLPHGEEILAAVSNGKLEDRHFEDLREGARKGMTMYLRMAHWALYGTER